MIPLLALLLGTVQVDAPQDCLVTSALADALDDVGGVDVAERVSVDVKDGPINAIDARPSYLVGIDIALVHADPLHRDVVIRPVECKDLPDLVALLVKEQRTVVVQHPLALPPPELTHASHDDRIYLPGWSPCDGPPDCGGSGLDFDLGPSATLFDKVTAQDFVGARVSIDFQFAVAKHFAIVVEGDVLYAPVQSAAILAVGAAWEQPVAPITASVRATLGGGIAGNFYKGTSVVVVPTLAARGRLGWLFLEAGAFVELSTAELPGPGLYLAFGFDA